jgi:histidinol-phosphate phosphatase family protein
MTGAGLRPLALLCDRDGTLVHDVPYNGDPDRVAPLDGVREALDRARASGLAIGVVTNQSGVADGRISPQQLEAVHERLEDELGPFDAIVACVHGRHDGCSCRKPEPGLVLQAAALLGVDPADCVVVGDTIADIHAALASGAWAILVPNDVTKPQEVLDAPVVAPSFEAAVDLVLEVRRA